MKNIDDYVTDNSPIIDKYLTKYDEQFTVWLSTEFYHLSMIETFSNIVYNMLMSSSTLLHWYLCKEPRASWIIAL